LIIAFHDMISRRFDMGYLQFYDKRKDISAQAEINISGREMS